jgi:lipopolysaccharide/colanic/teichoic acid biosynthesis glycosyltransferase
MKRVFDIVVSIIGMILLSPIIGAISIAIWIYQGIPVLFRQKRPGVHGQPFEMVKFSTMRDTYGEQGVLLPDEDRLTKLGKFLRATSLDELPELWNVLKGDMSIVGPRPLLMEYLPLYSKEQYRRHEVKPGITGWAQVNGRNAISWEEKFKLDIWYVDNQSFWLDLKIILLTFIKVFKSQGISQEGHATMEKFTGTQQ